MKIYTVIALPLLLFLAIHLPSEGSSESAKLIFYAIVILVQSMLLIAAHEKAVKSGKGLS